MKNAFPTRMGKTTFCPAGGLITFTRYEADHSPAIRIVAEDGEPLAMATVCLVDAPPPDGHVWLKGWTENDGIPEALQAAGVLRLTERCERVGMALAVLGELSAKAKALLPPVREEPQFQPTPRPSSCPWGKIDDAEQIAPGIWSVNTPSHGGFILSGARLQAMPGYLRINDKPGRNPHAFEEDCDWALVVMAFPQEFHETTRYNAGRVISGTSRFSFPGFDAAPWKNVLEKHPPLKLSDLSRESRITLARYRNWNNPMTEEQATAYVDSGEDLKDERA
jgi:hypothetical protein